MALWAANQVSINGNTDIITVVDGDDVGVLKPGYIIQIGANQIMGVKTRNTENQTIQVDRTYTGSNITGATAIAAPTQGQITELVDAVNAFLTLHQSLSNSVAASVIANSILQRNGSGQALVADATADNHAVAFGQLSDGAFGPDCTDFGVGGVSITAETDLNSGIYIEAGMTGVSAPISTLTNRPSDPTSSSRYVYEMRGNTSNGVQRVTNITSGITYQRNWTIDVPGGWVELYHSGNSVNPLDFNYGVTTGLITTGGVTDANDINATGIYLANSIANNGDLECIHHFYRFDTATGIRSVQIGWVRDSGKLIQKQRVNDGGTWRDWQTIYDSGNTLVDRTIATAGGGALNARFVAASATAGSLYVSLSKNERPTGFTIDGTITIANHGSMTSVITGLDATDFSFNGRSDVTLMRLYATGLSGLTGGETYAVRMDDGVTGGIIATY